MSNEINIENQNIPYDIRVSRKARRLRISVSGDNGVVVTLPWGTRLLMAERFVRQKRDWILKSINYFNRFKGRVIIKSSRRDFLNNRAAARILAHRKVLQWNKVYGFNHGRISIRNQKTRWGSCSKKGNLNFNYKIVHLPEPLVDYLVVHELCHLKEMNHSRNFWNLVSSAIPNYKILRKELRKITT